MGSILLTGSGNHDITAVSNYFIDNYMMSANGEFVKLYIYLLRLMRGTDTELSLTALADTLNHTEKDVLRALKYWENAGLISAAYSQDGELTSINILSPEAGRVASKEAFSYNASYKDSYNDKDANAVNSNSLLNSEKAAKESSPASQKAAPVHKTRVIIPPERMEILKNDDDIGQLPILAETYLGKTLSPNELNILFGFYDVLHLPFEVIDYLLDYCAENNHISFNYIESVAINWAEQGFLTPEDAKDYVKRRSSLCSSIMKSFGFSGRTIADTEMDYIDKWTTEYGFSNEIIISACNKTIETANNPSFKYADSILDNWRKQGIKSLEDIESNDKVFVSSKKKASAVNIPAPKPRSSYSPNFTQRTYNFKALEKELINRK